VTHNLARRCATCASNEACRKFPAVIGVNSGATMQQNRWYFCKTARTDVFYTARMKEAGRRSRLVRAVLRMYSKKERKEIKTEAIRECTLTCASAGSLRYLIGSQARVGMRCKIELAK
jgi:hypothetical protein